MLLFFATNSLFVSGQTIVFVFLKPYMFNLFVAFPHHYYRSVVHLYMYAVCLFTLIMNSLNRISPAFVVFSHAALTRTDAIHLRTLVSASRSYHSFVDSFTKTSPSCAVCQLSRPHIVSHLFASHTQCVLRIIHTKITHLCFYINQIVYN